MNNTRANANKIFATASDHLEQGIERVRRHSPRLETDIRSATYRSPGPPEFRWCSGEQGHEDLQGTRCQTQGSRECGKKHTSQRHVACSSKSKKANAHWTTTQLNAARSRTRKVFLQTPTVHPRPQRWRGRGWFNHALNKSTH